MKCRTCGIELTANNKVKDVRWCQDCRRIWNKEYNLTSKRQLYIKNYRRHHTLRIGGKTTGGLNKRKFPLDGKCEICGKDSKRMDYHHWDDNKPRWGIWSCHRCHFMEEGIDHGYDEIYKTLKKYIMENSL